jgi:hypothetical protein
MPFNQWSEGQTQPIRIYLLPRVSKQTGKSWHFIMLWTCLFVCFPGVTTHYGCIFHSPVAGCSLLVFEVSWSHTMTRHSRQDYSGRVINPSQRLLPDNTQHSQQTSMPQVGYEPTISAGERPKTYALDRATTGSSCYELGLIKYSYTETP